MNRFFFLFFFLFLTQAEIHAETRSEKKIVVTAKRLPRYSFAHSYNGQTIPSTQIEHQQQNHVLQTLQAMPGLTIVQSGGMGAQTTIFTRGTNGNHTQVRVDGMRANNPGNPNGSFDFADLTTDGVDQIQVLRGAGSSLYGSDVLGGVVLISTKEGTGTPRGSLQAEAGSFKTFQEKGEVQGEINGFHAAISASQLNSGGIIQTPRQYQTRRFSHKADPYRRTSVNSCVGVKLSPEFSVSLYNRLIDANFHYRTNEAPSERDTFFHLHRLVLDHEVVDQVWSHSLGVGFLRSHQKNIIKQSSNSTSIGKRFQADWQHNLKLHETYQIKAIVELDREQFSYERAAQDNSGAMRTIAFRQNHEFQPIKDLFMGISLSKDWNNRFKAPFTYRLESSYLLQPTATKLLASTGTGFKEPSLYELFGNTSTFRANPDLKPERIRAWDVGIEQKLGERHQISVSYFHNRLTDLIAANDTFTQLINYSKATTFGVESIVLISLTDYLSSEFGYTWVRTKNLETKKSLLRRPQHKVSGSLWFNNHDGFKFGISAVYHGAIADIDPKTFERTHRPGFLIMRVFGDYQLTPCLRVHARVENAADRHYQDPLGYRKPGIAGYAGLKYTLS
jgi:vitamin B12 transporter